MEPSRLYYRTLTRSSGSDAKSRINTGKGIYPFSEYAWNRYTQWYGAIQTVLQDPD